jgi:hypothetical protein
MKPLQHEERRVTNLAKPVAIPRVLGLIEHINHLFPDNAIRTKESPPLSPDGRRRLAFLGFLRNLCLPTDVVDGRLVSRFIRRACRWPEWNENPTGLASETHSLIEHWSRTHGFNPDLEPALRADRLQAVEVHSAALAEDLIRASLDRRAAAGDRLRLIPQLHRDRWVALRLKADRQFDVQLFGRRFLLSQGAVEPLDIEYRLHYDASLQLRFGPDWVHEIPLDDGLSSARFHLTEEGGLHGAVVHGPLFERRFGLDGAELTQYPEVFYSLKRLETLYVARQSDPTYRELLSILEKAVDLLDRGHPEALRFAQAAHHRGQLAMKYIYCDSSESASDPTAGLASDRGDKLVRILLGSLEKSLALGQLER